MNRPSMRLAAPALAAALCGCFMQRFVAPEKRYYVIEAPRPGEALKPPSNGLALRVERCRISPRYDLSEFIYRIGDLNYESDFYSEYFVAPNDLAAEETRKWLERAGLFEMIVDAYGRVPPTHTLSGVINSIYGDFRDKSAPRAAIEMQFLFSREVEGRGTVLFQKDYSQSVAIEKAAAADVAAGLSQALSAILGQLEKDIRQAMEQAR